MKKIIVKALTKTVVEFCFYLATMPGSPNTEENLKMFVLLFLKNFFAGAISEIIKIIIRGY